MRKVPKAERDAAVQRVAKMLQIEHLLERKPGALSGGQRQRVAMGRALARDPKLFLFDEPLSNLDAKLRVEMRAEIKLLHQRTHTTTVYVTHDQVEAMTLGDRIAVMRAGRIEQLDTPQEIYERPATKLRRRVHRLAVDEPVRLRAQRRRPACRRHRAAVERCAARRRSAPARRCCYGLRPENVTLAEHGVPGKVIMVEPTGPGDLCADRHRPRPSARARPGPPGSTQWRRGAPGLATRRRAPVRRDERAAHRIVNAWNSPARA